MREAPRGGVDRSPRLGEGGPKSDLCFKASLAELGWNVWAAGQVG